MIDLTEQNSDKYIPLKDIANRQEISLKYLESIMSILSKANYITGMHGKGGGYKLSHPAQDYTAGSILRLTEGSLAPVSCLECSTPTCSRRADCRTLPMWKEFDRITNEYFDNITVAELAKREKILDYVI
jgi:Rrf2 family protein